jgi:hypothetical protein
MTMGYDYQKERPSIFTESGQVMFLKIRDRAKYLLREAGAFRMNEVIAGCSGSSWEMIACVDRLVELGEIEELKREAWGQYRCFTSTEPKK